jgi:hypothetical protein
MVYDQKDKNQMAVSNFVYEKEHTHISTSLLLLGPGGNLSYFCTLLLYLYSSISVTRIPSKKGPAKQIDANMI